MIEDLNEKIGFMSSEFEGMLHDLVGKMRQKLEAISEKWDEAGDIHLSDANQRRLVDFHLARMHISGKDLSLPPV